MLWAFVYAWVITLSIMAFGVSPILGYLSERYLGFEAIQLWLSSNVFLVPTVLGLANALTRGVAAVRRM